MQKFFQQLLPYLIFGIIIVVLVAGIVLLSYLLIFGAVVGLVLFAINWIKERFFTPTAKKVTRVRKQPGRTIDHDK